MISTIQHIASQLQPAYPADEAEALAWWIAEETTGLTRTELQFGCKSTKNIPNLQEIITRLLHFEPIQYIFGHILWAGLDLKVTPATLIKLANEEPKAGVVGWQGDFTAMAKKTVLRRLLSQYGYLSIEMQQAIANDNEGDTALSERDDTIEGRGNSQVIETEEANYEEVDKETGEIKQPQPEAPAAPEGSTQQDGTLFNNGGEEGPGY